MILGVISDTHGRLDASALAVDIMKSKGASVAIHCGDVGGGGVVGLFESLPTHFVAGNCDNVITLQMAVEAAGQSFHGRAGELEIEGRKIAFLHGDSSYTMQQLLADGNYELILHGHTHMAGCQRFGKTLILNPGAMTRCQQPTVALVRLPAIEITVVPVESA